MRGKVAKRLREEARVENEYPSSHELVYTSTSNVEVFPGRVLQVDNFQIKCVGRRMTYLQKKRAYKRLNWRQRTEENRG